jgi:hypothetical protein
LGCPGGGGWVGGFQFPPVKTKPPPPPPCMVLLGMLPLLLCLARGIRPFVILGSRLRRLQTTVVTAPGVVSLVAASAWTRRPGSGTGFCLRLVSLLLVFLRRTEPGTWMVYCRLPPRVGFSARVLSGCIATSQFGIGGSGLLLKSNGQLAVTWTQCGFWTSGTTRSVRSSMSTCLLSP